MKHSGSKRNLLVVTVISLLLALAMPATSFGKDQGRRGRGRDNRRWKCGKFVNCHDARNGRWDGRGPRGVRVGNIVLRNRIRNRSLRFNNNPVFIRNVRRNRIRSFDDDDVLRDRRWRYRNRMFLDDRGFRHQRGRHGHR